MKGSLVSFPGQQEKPPFDGNLSLVQAMNKLALNDKPETRKELYAALLGFMLLVRVPEIPAGLSPGMQTTKSGMQIHLISTLDRNQARVTAAFTDLEALRRSVKKLGSEHGILGNQSAGSVPARDGNRYSGNRYQSIRSSWKNDSARWASDSPRD